MTNPARPLAAAALALCLAIAPALADGQGRGHDHERDRDGDHDLARELYEHGVIRSLRDVLAAVLAKVPGDVVAVDLVSKADGWIYQVQVVTADGRRVIVDVNATDATVVDHQGGDT